MYATRRNLEAPLSLYHSPGTFAYHIIEILVIVAYNLDYQKGDG
jgi:hypothetical protein